jgi:hypothetical protein
MTFQGTCKNSQGSFKTMSGDVRISPHLPSKCVHVSHPLLLLSSSIMALLHLFLLRGHNISTSLRSPSAMSTTPHLLLFSSFLVLSFSELTIFKGSYPCINNSLFLAAHPRMSTYPSNIYQTTNSVGQSAKCGDVHFIG